MCVRDKWLETRPRAARDGDASFSRLYFSPVFIAYWKLHFIVWIFILLLWNNISLGTNFNFFDLRNWISVSRAGIAFERVAQSQSIGVCQLFDRTCVAPFAFINSVSVLFVTKVKFNRIKKCVISLRLFIISLAVSSTIFFS